MTGVLLGNSSLFGKTLEIAGRDPSADLFFVGFPVAGTGYDVEAFARDAAGFIAATGKPLVLSVPHADIAAPFIKRGVPVFDSDRQALQALSQLAAHAAMMRSERDPGDARASVGRLTGEARPSPTGAGKQKL